MPQYTVQERAAMVRYCYEHGSIRKAQAAFAALHPNSSVPSLDTVSRAKRKHDESGNQNNKKRDPVRLATNELDSAGIVAFAETSHY